MNKQDLRKEIRLEKQKYSADELLDKSKEIVTKVLKEPDVISAKCILVYWSLDDEVNTHELVSVLNKDKKVLLPVVNGKELELREFTGVENMVKVPPYGILEPLGEVFNDLNLIDVVLVPGMAFDLMGNRLGRGKAYYDGLLPKLKCKKIGLCFDFQNLIEIAVEPHDVKMDKVITNYPL